MNGKFLFLFLIIAAASCTRTRVVQSRYVINTDESISGCIYTWQQGDYWELLGWALMDDPSAASALAITAGYTPDTFPRPGDDITIPIPEEYSQAAVDRMQAARLVREATEIRFSSREQCRELLETAMELDPVWSVPVINMTVLLMEENRTEEALELLEPLSHKCAPAMVLAGIEWKRGCTSSALNHLAEALSTDNPRPEALAAAGIAWLVTGERSSAAAVFRRLLENPGAPSELRILALQYALMLEQ